jgi:molybdopterin-containing oxidoreductase family membrane subunit
MRARHSAVILEASLRPVLHGGRRFWSLAAALSAAALAGLSAYAYQLINGLGVTALNDQFFWGIYETNLVTFIALSYGGALVSALLRITGVSWRAPITRLAEATALMTVLVGSLFAVIHLGHPERTWQLIVAPQFASPIVWDFVAITTYIVATIIFLYLSLIPDLAAAAESAPAIGPRRARLYRWLAIGWTASPAQTRMLDRAMLVISLVIVPVAITVHSVLAWAFSVHVRPGWHSSIFGPYFVVGAIFSGVAALVLVCAAFRAAYRLDEFIQVKHFRYLGYMLLALGLAYLYFTFSDLLTESYVMSISGEHLMSMLLTGLYAPFFWLFVALGIIVPTALVAWPGAHVVRRTVAAASLVVATMWMKRFLIIVPTLAVPQIEESVHGHTYVPSAVEIVITLGAFAAIPLLLMLFFRLFPIMSIFELEEVDAHESDGAPRARPAVASGGEPA